MIREYQVTLLCESNKYKPVSCIIKQEAVCLLNKQEKTKLMREGVKKICQKRYWTSKDLERYGYSRVLVREYDRAKIEARNKARYEAIKQEKYESGEWKRPKAEN